MELRLTEKWTGPIDVQLLADGVPADLTGTTVALILTDRAGTLVAHTGVVSYVDASVGKVRYEPGATDLDPAKTPHRFRFKITDAGTRVVYFPSGAGDRLLVFEE